MNAQRRIVCFVTVGLVAAATSLSTDVAQADPPIANEQAISCKVTEFGVHFGAYGYVKCDTAWSNPSTGAKASTFAISGPEHTAQLLSVGHTAFNQQKKVSIKFYQASSDAPAGCTDQCRKLTSIAVIN